MTSGKISFIISVRVLFLRRGEEYGCALTALKFFEMKVRAIAMKELYIKPEIEILLPLCEDIMTSSAEVNGDGGVSNPDAALPSVPSGSGTGETPADSETDPNEVNHGGNADTGTLDH